MCALPWYTMFATSCITMCMRLYYGLYTVQAFRDHKGSALSTIRAKYPARYQHWRDAVTAVLALHFYTGEGKWMWGVHGAL